MSHKKINPAFVTAFDSDASNPLETITSNPEVVDSPYWAQSWRHFENVGKEAMAGILEAEPHLERCSCDRAYPLDTHTHHI